MIAIKRVCKFFDTCYSADETSRTCTIDADGNHCGIYQTLARLEKEKEKKKKRTK